MSSWHDASRYKREARENLKAKIHQHLDISADSAELLVEALDNYLDAHADVEKERARDD